MTSNLLSLVRERLESEVGRIRLVSQETGIPYDTILRIKNEEGDPGYSKVQTLADHFGIRLVSKKSRANQGRHLADHSSKAA